MKFIYNISTPVIFEPTFDLSNRSFILRLQVLFYASEVILGLEHMHNRYICYRDLKVFLLFCC